MWVPRNPQRVFRGNNDNSSASTFNEDPTGVYPVETKPLPWTGFVEGRIFNDDDMAQLTWQDSEAIGTKPLTNLSTTTEPFAGATDEDVQFPDRDGAEVVVP
jgi:hypothetical protein